MGVSRTVDVDGSPLDVLDNRPAGMWLGAPLYLREDRLAIINTHIFAFLSTSVNYFLLIIWFTLRWEIEGRPPSMVSKNLLRFARV